MPRENLREEITPALEAQLISSLKWEYDYAKNQIKEVTP
jgi:hypothetical protein